MSELLKQFPGQKFFLHHRLDKDTSGVLVLAKHPKANQPMSEIFKNHQIQKKYLCLCLRSQKSMPMKALTEPFKVINHLAPVRDPKKKLMRMVTVKSGGWKAETEFVFQKSLRELDLFEAYPFTGRTHQIRVHIASQFRPIAGDSLYGGKSSLVPRLMLHASEIKLSHPVTGEPLVIESPMPQDFASVIRSQS